MKKILVFFICIILLINLTLAVSITSSAIQNDDQTDDEEGNCVKVGKICGGIQGLICCSGLKCKYDGNYPDASGTCIKNEEDKNKISGTGTIKFVDVEGGCWKIVGNDGVNYEPVNLDDNYKQDGLLVKFEAELVNDSGSICMVGTLIRLTEIEKKENNGWKKRNITKEEFKEAIKEKNRIKFENRTGVECPDECKCTGVVMKCELEDGGREMTVYAKSGNIIFQVKNVNATTQVTLYQHNKTVYAVFKNNETKAIILPDEAKAKLIAKLKAKAEIRNMTLNENGTYIIEIKKRARLFWIIPVNENADGEIDAGTGQVIIIKNPWWGFLARDVKED